MTGTLTTLPASAVPAVDTPSHRATSGLGLRLCEQGWIPDVLARAGMRRLLRQRLRDEGAFDGERRAARLARLLEELRSSPVAVATDAANAQHYELPSSFFAAHLGPRMKYSCCLYPTGEETLGEAERAMLECYVERAGLADGQDILELGCGWGSLSLWLARRFPNSRIVGLSNSHSQREYIEARAAERGLDNVTIVTGDIVGFRFSGALAATRFDRVISIEMFEHMKNYGQLFAQVAEWLRPDGKLFVHVFAHRTLAYHFEVRDGSDWMSRHFFTGGTMPSESLFLHFQDELRVVRQWWVSGTHYERTANDWLASLDAARARVMPALVDAYGAEAALWLQRWRMFYMAVAELFGYDGGNEWGVAHYLFERR